MAESTFRGTLGFLNELGVFDVVLPFLLVFTIVFAILEKTRIFGTEEVEGHTYTKKNLNSLAAFTVAFFTIASSRVVDAITNISANVVILLFASVFFLMLVGSFNKQADKEGFPLPENWKTFFVFIMFAGLAGIFLNAIEGPDGRTWLEWIIHWLADMSQNVSVATIVLILVTGGAVYLITRGDKPTGSGSGGNSG